MSFAITVHRAVGVGLFRKHSVTVNGEYGEYVATAENPKGTSWVLRYKGDVVAGALRARDIENAVLNHLRTK